MFQQYILQNKTKNQKVNDLIDIYSKNNIKCGGK